MKKIWIYGAGKKLDEIVNRYRGILTCVEGIIDGDLSKVGKERYGFTVRSNECIPQFDEKNVIIISSMMFYEEIKKDIYALNSNVSIKKVEQALAEDFPVVGECNLCGEKVKFWGETGVPQTTGHNIIGAGIRFSACPKCGSNDRFRWSYYVLQHYTNLFVKGGKVLHFAPEPALENVFRTKENIEYYTADIDAEKVDYKVDMTDMPFEDDSYDCIIANHVLEHIIDDKKAVSELRRCLKPDGVILLSFPICLEIDTYENELIVTPEERVKVFGQLDHVRIYGRDYRVRLEKYGLNVREYVPEKCVSEEDIRKYCFISQDRALLCAKSE